MAVRNCRFELRLSQEELNDLTEKADRAGISKADFVRKTIKGKTIKEAPPVDVPLLIGGRMQEHILENGLFQKEGKYKGNTLRTHAGGVWLDGYSDHLPTVVYLVKQVK